MSSDIMSRPIPVERFGLIYAGAQKNIGPAGATLVIVRQDILDRCSDALPAYLSYKVHVGKGGLYNTPPVFNVYMIKKVLEWLKAHGGVEGAQKRARECSAVVYGAIDASSGFYKCPISEDCRSVMNLVWRLPDKDLERKFLEEAAANNMLGLKGHRSVGGCRASMYNAMPLEGAKTLADFMGEFVQQNG